MRATGARLPVLACVAGYKTIVDCPTRDGTVPVAVQRQEISLRGRLLGVAKDKLPPPEKVFDFSPMQEANKELDNQGWKPKR
jgi:hypothetical protein